MFLLKAQKLSDGPIIEIQMAEGDSKTGFSANFCEMTSNVKFHIQRVRLLPDRISWKETPLEQIPIRLLT